jgi:phage-related protein
VTDGSPPDVVFEGDSLDVIKEFSKDARENLGGDLRRVQKGEMPLDSGSLANILPKVFYLRDDDQDFWYRVPYIKLDGVVYVLDCFKKKTNEISQKNINTARLRLGALKQRLAEQKKKAKRTSK